MSLGVFSLGLVAPAAAQVTETERVRYASTASSRFVSHEQLQGAAVQSTAGKTDPRADHAGGTDTGVVKPEHGKQVGTIVDVVVPRSMARATDASATGKPVARRDRDGKTIGGSGAKVEPAAGNGHGLTAGKPGHGVIAIIRLTAPVDSVPGRAGTARERGGAASVGRTIQMPLTDLRWDPAKKVFTCSKSEAEIMRMKDFERANAERPRRDRGGTDRGDRRVGRERRDRPVVERGRDRDHRLMGRELARAELRSKDDEKAKVAGLVFDVQQGALSYVLAERDKDAAGDAGKGKSSGKTGQTDAAARLRAGDDAAEACVVPFDVIAIERSGPRDRAAGSEDAADRRAMRSSFVLRVPLDADKLAQSPKIDSDDLSSLDQAAMRQRIDRFYQSCRDQRDDIMGKGRGGSRR